MLTLGQVLLWSPHLGEVFMGREFSEEFINLLIDNSDIEEARNGTLGRRKRVKVRLFIVTGKHLKIGRAHV